MTQRKKALLEEAIKTVLAGKPGKGAAAADASVAGAAPAGNNSSQQIGISIFWDPRGMIC